MNRHMATPVVWETYTHIHLDECYKYEKRKLWYCVSHNKQGFYQKAISLTTLNGMWGHLERHVLTPWLGNVNAEHQSHTGILPPDVCLAFPQLYISIPELQNPSAVDSRKESSRGVNWYQDHSENPEFILKTWLIHAFPFHALLTYNFPLTGF